MKPLILVSGAKTDNYIDAVDGCGGTPVEQYDINNLDKFDGLLICGGCDVHPKFYNEEIAGSVNMNEERDVAEMELIKSFVKMKKPIFGICRGYQLLNVAFGGNLYQDIPNAYEHCSVEKGDLVHEITANKDSFLFNMYGEKFSVNSHHHQAIDKLGDGFEITALTSDETTIEAISHKELPIFGVQWHPEAMTDDETQKKIFSAFIKAAEKYQGGKLWQV